MPEEKDVDKNIYTVNRPEKREGLYEGIDSHAESERNEEREGGPDAPMKDLTGPIVLSESTYVGEDSSFEEEKRKPPPAQKKKSK